MDTYTLPDLPYAFDAMAPLISEKAMHLHHDKHHGSYVKAANETLDKLTNLQADGEAVPLLAKLAFNASGHALHSLFWTSISPDSTEPTASLATALKTSFGSTENASSLLASAITNLSGSGWAAMVWEPIGGRLMVTQIHDHQSEHIAGALPILALDGWEHAYYLDHQSDRAGWAKQIVEVIDWVSASRRFDAAGS